MTQAALAFDEAEHAYTLGDVKLPSVTQILSFGQDLSRIPRWTAERGTAFHLASEYDDAGDLDESSVDPLVKPHLDAYRKWRARVMPEYIATELRVWGEIDGLRYAGCIDRVALRDLPAVGRNPRVAIIDLKTGAPRKEHGAQLWAYKVAYQQHEDADVPSLIGLYLGKDATYQVKDYFEGGHFETFRAALHRWWDAQEG